MKTFATIEEALDHAQDHLTRSCHAFRYGEIDADEVRFRMITCADHLTQIMGYATKQREKEARGGYMTVRFDTEGPELTSIFGAIGCLGAALHNAESALGLVIRDLEEKDTDAPGYLSGPESVLHLAAQAIRASIHNDLPTVQGLKTKLVTAHVEHCETRNALAEGVAA